MGTWPMVSRISPKLVLSSSHSNLILKASPSGDIRVACTVWSEPEEWNLALSEPDFHLFRLPIRHFHSTPDEEDRFRSKSDGSSGSRQNISMTAPLSFRKTSLALITRVLLKTRRVSGLRMSGSSLKTLSSVTDPLHTRSFEMSLTGKGYFAI